VRPALPQNTLDFHDRKMPEDKKQYPGIGLDELAEGEVMWRADS